MSAIGNGGASLTTLAGRHPTSVHKWGGEGIGNGREGGGAGTVYGVTMGPTGWYNGMFWRMTCCMQLLWSTA